jgi:hypothetical protein
MPNSDSVVRRGTYSPRVEDFGDTGIEKLDRMVRVLDDLIRIPILNIRIGLDPILGLIPWAGDTMSAMFSIYLIGSAFYLGAPKIVILRMALNVAFDYLIGLVPFLGDAADFFFKSNRRNLRLLREYASENRRPGFFDYLFVIAVIGGLIAMVIGGVTLVIYFLRSAGKLDGIW